jgi:hypothetical protein
MSRSIKSFTPEELLSKAIEEQSNSPTEGELRLLISGYIALKENKKKTINKTELVAISNLLTYVAYNQSVNEDMVLEVLLTRYNIKKIEELQAHHFMDAIEYLVDLDMNKVMN